MQTQIKGQIQSVAAVTTHTEPKSEIDFGIFNAGEQKTINLSFTNTGNVSQTVTMNSVNSFVNCSQVGSGKFLLQGNVPTTNPNVAILQPGKSCDYFIDVKANDTAIGEAMKDFSCIADWTWS